MDNLDPRDPKINSSELARGIGWAIAVGMASAFMTMMLGISTEANVNAIAFLVPSIVNILVGIGFITAKRTYVALGFFIIAALPFLLFASCFISSLRP